jgi:hypothetical protein
MRAKEVMILKKEKTTKIPETRARKVRYTVSVVGA